MFTGGIRPMSTRSWSATDQKSSPGPACVVKSRQKGTGAPTAVTSAACSGSWRSAFSRRALRRGLGRPAGRPPASWRPISTDQVSAVCSIGAPWS
jgi:hypothetical protein